MSKKIENLLVKIIKKSVGLPTENSKCCGTTAEESMGCCGVEQLPELTAGCGCGDCGCGGGCCNSESNLNQ